MIESEIEGSRLVRPSGLRRLFFLLNLLCSGPRRSAACSSFQSFRQAARRSCRGIRRLSPSSCFHCSTIDRQQRIHRFDFGHPDRWCRCRRHSAGSRLAFRGRQQPAFTAIDESSECTRRFSPKPGHRNLPAVVLAEPVDVKYLRQVLGFLCGNESQCAQ